MKWMKAYVCIYLLINQCGSFDMNWEFFIIFLEKCFSALVIAFFFVAPQCFQTPKVNPV